MTDLSHLHALEIRRANEIGHKARARTANDAALRAVWIAQVEKEIAAERAFLGLAPEAPAADMTDGEILAELGL